MADTFTTSFNLRKPEVGGSRDAWGAGWNDNADKIDAALVQVAVRNSPCEVIWVNASTLRLKGRGGNSIIIDGQFRTIPADGIDFVVTTAPNVVASADNFLVAFWDKITDPNNPKIGLKAVQTARTVHSTLGYATCGVDAETLVAGFRTEVDKTILYNDAHLHMATWYGSRTRGVWGDAGDYSTASVGYAELSSALRISAFMWGDRACHASGNAYIVETGADDLFFGIAMDGNFTDNGKFYQGIVSLPAGYGMSVTPSGAMRPGTDGYHEFRALGRTARSTVGHFNSVKITATIDM